MRRPRVVLGVQNNVSVEMAERKSFLKRLDAATVDRAYSAASAVVALSKGVGEDFSHHYPAVADRVSVAYNIGCDEKMFALAKEPLSDLRRPEGPLVVACGRLTAQKDYPTLLRAMQIVLRERQATLWILGKGSEEARLKGLCQELALGEAVRFLGFRANPFQCMAAADVFALSSAWEGFGNVVVEAMACGAPVVATRCPYGPEEILERGTYGELVEVGDVEALARGILGLLGDPARRARLAEAGRERAREFLPGGITRAYEDVFARALDSSSLESGSRDAAR
jgi:glycosyltransferase involved in cell wall biosynthesis